MGPGHSHYLQALELSRGVRECFLPALPGIHESFSYGLQIANILNCTSWSGVGLGLMRAATKGALEVGKPVGGLKIVRSSSSDRIAVVALPGGIGTLDKVFEILALIQLEWIGSELPVPPSFFDNHLFPYFNELRLILFKAIRLS
uniref:Cytokinin riboside 5'-monophosphate phosphoribohydrolase n=1 Tax=Quercus lobata TaxID=97700 RepID=A0A7N2R4L0_QUELO